MNLNGQNLFDTFKNNVVEWPLQIYEEFIFHFYFAMLVERIVQMIRNHKKNDTFKENITSISHGILYDIVRIITYSSKLYLYTLVHTSAIIGRRYRLEEKLWVWLLCLLVMDFIYYWYHRLSHEVHYLWAFHQLHHSSEQLNFTTAVRRSPMEHLHSFIFYIPVALVFPPRYIMYNLHAIAFYQLFMHTETFDGIPLLEKVFNMPKHHRVHHVCNKTCMDKNYGGILIIWDRVFGTFQTYRKRLDARICYGLMVSPSYFNLYYQQTFGLSELIKKVKTVKPFYNKMLCFVMGPRWIPGRSRLGGSRQKKQRPCDKDSSIKLDWSTYFSYIISITLVIQHCEWYLSKMDTFTMTLALFNILFTFLACGLYLDNVSPLKVALIETIHWSLVPFYCSQNPAWITQVYVAIYRFYAFYFVMVLFTGICMLLTYMLKSGNQRTVESAQFQENRCRNLIVEASC